MRDVAGFGFKGEIEWQASHHLVLSNGRLVSHHLVLLDPSSGCSAVSGLHSLLLSQVPRLPRSHLCWRHRLGFHSRDERQNPGWPPAGCRDACTKQAIESSSQHPNPPPAFLQCQCYKAKRSSQQSPQQPSRCITSSHHDMQLSDRHVLHRQQTHTAPSTTSCMPLGRGSDL
jgi:hypothetical protein